MCVCCVTVKYYMVRVRMRLFRCKTATACWFLLKLLSFALHVCRVISYVPVSHRSFKAVSLMCGLLTTDEAEANGSGDLEMSYYREEDNSGQSDRVYGTLEDSTEG
jgi:hypothetical protein